MEISPKKRLPGPWDAWALGTCLLVGLLRPQEAYPLVRVATPAVLGLILAARVAQTPDWHQLRQWAPLALALVAFPLWSALVTYLQAPSWHVAARLLGTHTQGALVALWGLHCVGTAPDPVARARGLLAGLGGLVALLCLVSLHRHFVIQPETMRYLEERAAAGDLEALPLLGAMVDGRMRGTLGDPNHMGLLAAMGAIALWGLALLGGARRVALIAIPVSLISVLTLGLSSSRGALLGLLGGAALLPMTVFSRRRGAGRRLLGVAGLALIGLLAVALLVSLTPGLRERLGNVSTVRERLGYWQIAWQVFLLNPLMGTGAGSFAAHYPILRPDWLGTAQLVHCLPLQVLAEAGIIGLLLVLWPLALCRPALREQASAPVAWALAAVLGAFAVTSLTSHSPLFRELWLVAAAMLGALLGLTPQDRADARRHVTPQALAVPVALLALLALGIPPDVRDARGREFLDEARALLATGDLGGAVGRIDYAAQINPSDDHHLVECARTLMAIGPAVPTAGDALLDRAAAMLDRAAMLNPTRPSILTTRAEIAARRGDPEKAIALQEEAIALHPAEWTLRIDLVRHLIQGGRGEEALAVATEIQSDPRSDERADRALADALRALDRRAEAAATLRSALRQMPHPPAALWLQVAEDEHAAGNLTAAQEAAREAGRLAPNSAEIQGQVRRYLSLGGDR